MFFNTKISINLYFLFIYFLKMMMMMIKYHNDTTTFYVAVLEVVQMA